MTQNIVLFNNKGGVGKTTFNFHLGHALASVGKKILFVDLDPQCNLTTYICSETEILELWHSNRSIYHAIEPLIKGVGDFKPILPHTTNDTNISLLAGDIRLSIFEELLSKSWLESLSGDERGVRITSAIFRLIQNLSNANKYDYVLMDVGPNLGSLNRAVLLSCDYFFVPLVPDMFSLRGLENIGTTFSTWYNEWNDVKDRFMKKQDSTLSIQNGVPIFAGYINLQFNIYRQRATKAWQEWVDKIDPTIIDKLVNIFNELNSDMVLNLNNSSHKLGDFKNYHSLIPMSQTARKPVFNLTYDDGVIGTHQQTVASCKSDFENLANKIIEHIH